MLRRCAGQIIAHARLPSTVYFYGDDVHDDDGDGGGDYGERGGDDNDKDGVVVDDVDSPQVERLAH